MRRYETIYILRPNLGEEEISTVIENTNAIVQQEKGTIIELNKWGMKKLAYLIKKESLGYYVYCDYAGTPCPGKYVFHPPAREAPPIPSGPGFPS